MFNWFKETSANRSVKKTDGSPKPVITKGVDLENLSPAKRYALQPGRVYRNFPDDLPESAIPGSCSQCGNPYDGLTQTHCLACNQGRTAYKIDVTEEPYHTLPPKTENDAPTVNADELIPSFGGPDVELGQKSTMVSAIGNVVKIGSESVVDQIAGNNVQTGYGLVADVIVAKEKLIIGSHLRCEDSEGGITAKEISLGWTSQIDGVIILPNDGKLTGEDNCTINYLIAGEGATIYFRDRLRLDTLIILGPNVRISLGDDCNIDTIESNHRFQLQTGQKFFNHCKEGLQDDYNLAVEINQLVDLALATD